MKKRKCEKSLIIEIYEGEEPQFTFQGVWSPALLDRVYYKSRKALRMLKVRAAQQATKEAQNSENLDEEESDART